MKKRKNSGPKNKKSFLSTRENNRKQNKDYDELEIYHQMAIDMRLDGYTYFMIAWKLKQWAEKTSCPLHFPESEVRRWFAPGCKRNLCYFAFTQKKLERAREREANWEELDKSIQEGAIESVATLRANIRKGNTQASEIILKYAGKEPVQKHEVKQLTPTKVVSTVILSNGKHARIKGNPNAKAK